jgi:hypothetical protein
MKAAAPDSLAIKTSGLTYQFGNLTAVDHIELRVSCKRSKGNPKQHPRE